MHVTGHFEINALILNQNNVWDDAKKKHNNTHTHTKKQQLTMNTLKEFKETGKACFSQITYTPNTP